MLRKLILILTLCIGTEVFAEDWDGTTSKPSSKEIDGVEYYVITSPNELAWFAYQVNTNGKASINAILENDIYYMDDTTKLSSNNFNSIGNKTNPFDGIIDGNGKSIYGAQGTFFVDENTVNAVIKNLALKNTKYQSVVDTNKGLIENVELYGKTAYGFAYLNSGTIKNCSNFAEISGYINYKKRGAASGIAYKNAKDGNIISCNNAGIFIRAGIESYTIAPDSIVGGISIYNEGLIDSSESVIDLREADSLKGVYNYQHYGAFGGIVAYNSGSVRNSTGKVFFPRIKWKSFYGPRYIGGIVAINNEDGLIENSLSNLYIKSWSGISDDPSQATPWGSVFSGGISGVNTGMIQECRSVFTIDTLNISNEIYQNFFIGGVVGSNTLNFSAKIDQSYSEMHINRFGFSSALKNSNSMNVTFVGGVIGAAANTDIKDCHGLLHIGEKIETSSKPSGNFNLAGLASVTQPVKYSHNPAAVDQGTSISNSYVILKVDTDILDYRWLSGIVYRTSAQTKMSNVYFDKTVVAENYTKSITPVMIDFSEPVNVIGKTTAVMQSPAFVKTLNTNAGLSDDDSGIWQYCEGRYPILVSEGTCEEFYSTYGLSGSSQSSSSSTESSSTISSSSVESSSSQIPASSSSSDVIQSSSDKSSSGSMIASSSSGFSSSSKATSSSSAKQESSSSEAKSSSSRANSSSSEKSDFIIAIPQKTFNLAVNGMTITLSNTQGGNVRIFDALGHLIVAKPLSATGATNVTLQVSGSYIVRVNGNTKMVNIK